MFSLVSGILTIWFYFANAPKRALKNLAMISLFVMGAVYLIALALFLTQDFVTINIYPFALPAVLSALFIWDLSTRR